MPTCYLYSLEYNLFVTKEVPVHGIWNSLLSAHLSEVKLNTPGLLLTAETSCIFLHLLNPFDVQRIKHV